jgi:hypothetical protein
MFVLLSHQAASLFKVWPFLRAESLPARPVAACLAGAYPSIEKECKSKVCAGALKSMMGARIR